MQHGEAFKIGENWLRVTAVGALVEIAVHDRWDGERSVYLDVCESKTFVAAVNRTSRRASKYVQPECDDDGEGE